MSSELPSQRIFKESQISKTPVQVVLRTSTNLIKGLFHVRGAMRVIDELGYGEQFIPITDAVIYDAGGGEVLRSHFVAVNRNELVWMVPESDIEQAPSAEK